MLFRNGGSQSSKVSNLPVSEAVKERIQPSQFRCGFALDSWEASSSVWLSRGALGQQEHNSVLWVETLGLRCQSATHGAGDRLRDGALRLRDKPCAVVPPLQGTEWDTVLLPWGETPGHLLLPLSLHPVPFLPS
jgi:hypothetical protein